MSKKLYFEHEHGEDLCYSLDWFIELAKDEGLKEIELFEAEPVQMSDVFWCRAEHAFTETGYCGKSCEDYEPKNGKLGMCRHKGKCGYEVGNKVKFNVLTKKRIQ
jgi:hypothetical protein